VNQVTPGDPAVGLIGAAASCYLRRIMGNDRSTSRTVIFVLPVVAVHPEHMSPVGAA
jgi:hypothetical protein